MMDPIIAQAQARVAEAQKILEVLVKNEFFAGARIAWLFRGKHRHTGIVVSIVLAQCGEPFIIATDDESGKAAAVKLSMAPKRL